MVGEVIGVGIFLTPADMARGLGSPLLLLAVWLLVGAACVCGALCYGELAARYPEAGGGYVYLREAWGSRAAFLYGWKSLLVMDPGLTAALAAGLAAHASFAFPAVAGGERLVAAVVILLVAAVNALGLRVAGPLLEVATVLKLALIALLVLAGFASGRGDWAHFGAAEAPAGSLPGGLAAATVAAFFCFAGFWDVAKVAGEVREPSRTLPRALSIGVATVTLVYVLVSAVFLYLVPLDAATSSEAFVGRIGEALFGGAGGRLFAGVVVVAVLGSLVAVLMAAPRVYYAMARDGLFPASVGRLHPRSGVPARGILVQALLASALVAVGNFGEIIAYFMFVTLGFVAFTVAGLFRLPRPAPGAYRVPGYPWTPAAFLTLLAVLLGLIAGAGTRQAAVGCLVVALGVPVHRLLLRTRRGPAPRGALEEV